MLGRLANSGDQRGARGGIPADRIGTERGGEELAAELEERFLGLAENSPSMIFINQGGRVVYANPRAEEILGYPVAEMCAPDFDFRRLIAEEDHELVARAFARHRVGEEVAQYQYGLMTRDGRRLDAINATRLIRYRGEPAILGVVTDISDLVAARRKAEESEQIYRAVVESSPDSITMVDIDGHVLMANQEAARMQGFDTPAELLASGRSAFDLLADEDRQRVQDDLIRLLDEGSLRDSRFHSLLPNGERRLRESNATLLTDRDGNPTAFIAVTRDITARERAQEERLRLERQVLHAQKLESLGILAGGIAHDFNNLLAAILGSASLALRKLGVADPARGEVERIEIAAQRAAALTREMLAYSGRGGFEIVPVQVAALTRELGQLLAASIPKKVRMVFDLADDLPPVRADAGQLQQVIMNLISNAAEAIGEASGTITVRAWIGPVDRRDPGLIDTDQPLGAGSYLHLEFVDTGCGMDDETRARIFDPFFTTKAAGRGLGLASVLGIVRSHGGALFVTSSVGQGTTIRVVLPTSDAMTAAAEIGARSALRGEGGTVLVVDDELIVREVASAMFEALDVEVMTAVDGRQGLELFAAHADQIDGVLLDLTMPELNGEEVFRELLALRPGVRVILTSGYFEDEALERCATLGASILKKPFTIDELAEAWARLRA